jgi:diguanylate cyclase (GGDEF)-like protein/PAS domain S-box-containing protein
VVTFTDVTERKEAEEALKESEERYRAVMEQSVEAIYLYDAETKRVLEANGAFRAMVDYTADELMEMQIYNFIDHPVEDVDANIQRSLREKRRQIGERRYLRKDGSVIVVDTSASVIPYGGKTALCAVSRDVTERKRFEEALKESEGRFRQLFERSTDALFVHDERGRFVDCNAEACRALGYERDELLALSVADVATHLLSEEERRKRKDGTLWKRATRSEPGKIVGFEENELRRKDGTTLPVEVGVGSIEYEGRRMIFASVRDLTERKRAEETVKESEERYRAVVELSAESIWLFDPDTKQVLESNTTFQEMLGYTAEELRIMTNYDFVAHNRKDIDAAVQRLVQERRGFFGERKYRRKDGTVLDVEVSGTVIPYRGGEVVCGVARDLTERKRAEERLREAEERYRTVVEEQSELVCRFLPDLTITFVNDAYCRYFGVEPGEVIGKSFIGRVAVEDRVHYEELSTWLNEGNPRRTVEHRVLTPDGEVRWQQWTDTAIFDGEGNPVEYQSVGRDVTERRSLEERLEHQVLHDSLTDLPNRRLFVDRLKQALRRIRRREDLRVAVLFMDLDGFKAVNDSLGHDTGDRLLVEVKERLKGCLRPEDTLARFGGDEFVVLIEDVRVLDEAVRVAERIVEGLREPFLLDGRELYVDASIGVGLGTDAMNGSEELLREADTAMYRAKAEGSGYKVFDEAMYGRAVNRLELENDLRRAIEGNEFVVHYQPIVSLQTGAVWGVEALVRWEHPERGLLGPDEFVPVAEESGLVVPMGELVLEDACRRAVEWQREFPRTSPLALSVNLSGRQLRRPDLHEVIGLALTESGLPASSLGLDITETVYISALDANTAALDRLRALGIRISLDDFGSGYSSLSYLKRLPADILKIDRSFTKGLGVEVEDTAIVQTVIDLAHILGMEVVAEGVEIEEQETLLKEMGCDFAQGFYLSKPLQPDEVSRFLSG